MRLRSRFSLTDVSRPAAQDADAGSRNGYFFVLDRTNGKSLLTAPFGPVDWASGIDKQGSPMPDPAKEPAPDGRLIAPDEGGLTNYRSPSFDPKTGLFIVMLTPATASISISRRMAPMAGRARITGCGARASWRRSIIRRAKFAGATNLDLGDRAPAFDHGFRAHLHRRAHGNFLALETATARRCGMPAREAYRSSPITYELDGRQYLLTSGGTVLSGWALPENEVPPRMPCEGPMISGDWVHNGLQDFIYVSDSGPSRKKYAFV